jgi:subtilisin family serine protease
MSRHHFGLVSLLVLCAGCGFSQTERRLRAVSPLTLSKVEQKVIDVLSEEGKASIIVHLIEKAALEGIAAPDWKTRGRWTVDALRSVADRSQAPILSYLRANSLLRKVSEIEPLWICNCVVATSDEDTIASLAERADVKSIRANQEIKVYLEPAGEVSMRAADSVEWNIAKIRANEVWSDFGITGNGITVGSLDTGVRWDHPALKEKYRGWDGTAADHNYNWFDATQGGSRVPLDRGGHGTHTTGTMVGDDGTNQIGVAPGAQWIAVAMIDSGSTWVVAAHRGFQWMIAPTDLDGTNPNPDLRPAVVNNSWGCANGIPGCTDFEEFRDDVDAWIAAGIFPEFSAGNEGPGGATMRWPASYAEAFSTGATTQSDSIAGFSSRGPGRDGTVKPEVAAPGEGVRSSIGSGYGLMSGTSMAGPHVVGLVALLLEANPNLSIDDLTNIMETTAVPLGSPIPNNTFGWGRIDAYSAVESVLTGSRAP